MNKTITTGSGLEISVIEGTVFFSDPMAPEDLRNIEAGRIVFDGQGFQPAPFFPGAMGPDTLRDIADLIEGK